MKFRMRLVLDFLIRIRVSNVVRRLARRGIYAAIIVLFAFGKSGKPDASPFKSEGGTFSCGFTYLQPGENVPQIDPALLSLTSRNPVARIYNKVAKMAALKRELDGSPPVPWIQLRPVSMHLQCSSDLPEENALRRIEEDLDISLARLNKMLADNPASETLAYAH